MTDKHSLLPREVSALVHHVELNRAGWWEKALNRLVLAAVWLAEPNPDMMEICTTLQATFGLTIGPNKLGSILSALEAEDCLVQVAGGEVRIPDKARASFEQEIAEAEKVERNARTFFSSLAEKTCPALDAACIWNAFESSVLVPLVRDIGAHTYHLITGERMVLDGACAEHFMAQFGQEHRGALKALVTSFLDPKRADVRSFITRMLHAQFCVEASGITEEVLEKLKATTERPLRFRLFVDTNFLFSLLGLHENPSNASARELKDLLATLKKDPQVDLFVTPRTVAEAKRAIGAAKAHVAAIPASSNFTDAALRVGMSGMSERFFSERRQRGGRLTVSDWFDPYLKDFVPLAREAGVELFNENLDAYGVRQDVVDDIHLITEYEKRNLPEERRKSYDKVAHDVILWHLVKDKRPAYVESPVDAEEWILTVDFRLLGFDEHKRKASHASIPLCLHPTSLVQLLQFWVPRTQEFEEAILGGLRLPFLFQEFDVKAERLSIAIINRLGRFEGCEEISGDTLTKVVMNEGLRSRIDAGQPEQEEIQLVRDALVEEMRLQAETEKARVKELTEVLEGKSAALAQSSKERKAKDAEIKELQKKLDEEAEKSRAADERLSRLTKEQSKLESKMAQMEDERLQRTALFTYLGLLIVVVGVSSIGGWQAGRALSDLNGILGHNTVCVASGLCIFVIAHLLLELLVRQHQRFRKLWPFNQVRRFRKWLWAIAIALLISVAASSIVANIQNAKDARPAHPGLLDIPESPTEVGDEP